MVRHWVLVPAFGGSNPSSPARLYGIIYSVGLGLVLGFVIFDFSDMRITHDGGRIDTASIEFGADVGDLLRRKRWTSTSNIV